MLRRDERPSGPRVNVLLLVDDRPKSVEAIGYDVEQRYGDWAVEIVTTSEDAIRRIDAVEKPRLRLISIDLGLGSDPDGESEGLKLLAHLRRQLKGFPLVVHSQQTVRLATLRAIVKTPASFIRTRDDKGYDLFSQLVPFLADGYIVCSPSAGALLPDVVISNDPLTTAQWELLALLASEEPYRTEQDITDYYQLKSTTTISSRLSEIANRLAEAGLITIEKGEKRSAPNLRRPLMKFYRANHTKYGH